MKIQAGVLQQLVQREGKMTKKSQRLLSNLRQRRASYELAPDQNQRSDSKKQSLFEAKAKGDGNSALARLHRMSNRFTKLSKAGETEKATKLLAEYHEMMKVKPKLTVSQSSVEREILIPNDPSNSPYRSVSLSGANKAFALYDKLSKVLEKKLGKNRDVDEQSRRILLKMEELREKMAR